MFRVLCHAGTAYGLPLSSCGPKYILSWSEAHPFLGPLGFDTPAPSGYDPSTQSLRLLSSTPLFLEQWAAALSRIQPAWSFRCDELMCDREGGLKEGIMAGEGGNSLFAAVSWRVAACWLNLGG